MTNDLAALDVFYGDLTVNRAFVYARLPWPEDDAGLSLVGQVRGPRCLVAQTLPLTAPLVDLGPGPTLLARAVMPDPCFWSPDLPAIYDVTVNLLRGTEIVASTRREIGLRALGVRGRHFSLAGKRCVLRGVTTASTAADLPRQWHEAAAAYVTDRLDKSRLEEAGQFGALAAVLLTGKPEQIVASMRELALHPAAAMAVVDGELPADFKPTQVAPNVIVAQALSGDCDLTVRPWAQALWVQASDPRLVARLAGVDLPIIAVRPPTTPLLLVQARAACDELQRDLATIGQFAGYVV